MKRHYLGLDGIRFFAAASVMMYHFGYYQWLEHVDPSEAASAFRSAFSPLSDLLYAGWVGVPIFFVLSGFVIAFSSEGRTAGKFVKARAWRLYPAAWMCASITLVFVFADKSDVAERYVRSLALFPVGPWVDPVYWTLAVEMMFYALVAAVMLFFGPGHIQHLGFGLALVSSSYWVLRAADFATGGHYKVWFDFAEGPAGSLLLVSSGCYFGLGILIWWVREKGTSLLALGMCTCCLAAGVVAITASARFHLTRDTSPDQIRMLIAPALWLAAVAAIAASVYWHEHVARLLGHWPRTVRFIGLATYPLYLVHNEVGNKIMLISQWAGALPALILAVACVFVLAAGVVFVETRLTRTKRLQPRPTLS